MSDKLYTVSLSWDEIADRLGRERTVAIDTALSHFLADAAANRGGSIPKGDLYLVSEGAAYAVCMALLEHE